MSQDPDRQRTKDPIGAYFNLGNDKVPAKNIQTSDHPAFFYRVKTELLSPELILSVLLAVSGCFLLLFPRELQPQVTYPLATTSPHQV